jgi:putative membrane protein
MDNLFDFSIPSRQSYVAVLIIIFKTVRIIFSRIWPVIIVLFLGKSDPDDEESYFLAGMIVLTLLVMIISLINYFYTYFFVQDEALHLRKGVFTRKSINIPFERIQTINFEQNLIHSMFDVVSLKIDTAGSDQTEFEFYALSKSKANALRNLILEQKSGDSAVADEAEEIQPVQTESNIFSLPPGRLMKVGLSQNHLRSVGLIMLFFFWIFEKLQEAGVAIEEYQGQIPQDDFSVQFLFFAAIFFLAISVLISMFRTIFKYFNLRFIRTENGFKIISGLFTRRELAATDQKIQIILWADNLLKKQLKYVDLTLKQASSEQINQADTIKVPGVSIQEVRRVMERLYPEFDPDLIVPKKVSKKYFHRFASIISIVGLVVIGLFIYLSEWQYSIFAVFLVIVLLISRYLQYKKLSYDLNLEMLYLSGGAWGSRTTLLPIYKIQGVRMNQSPYQRKHNLASLSCFTASGTVKIPYISKSEARALMNQILFKVESSKSRWM